MAGDTNSNIFINIDTSQAMAQLRALEKELTALNRALIVGTKAASNAQSKYAQSLLHNVNATGQWTASMTRMRTASEQFASSLDRSKLSLKEYFRYGVASSKTFGKVFSNEFDTVNKLVEKRVKTLQQQYVQLGRDAQGAMNAMKFTPKALNYGNVTTQLMLATQRQQIFNKLLDDGATKLLNFGKNTQWAGRQLMVGFTIPLAIFGTQAIRTFKELETEIIRFRKVYGDIYTDPGQTEAALKNIRALADEYTKYGVKVADTIKMAAEAAAAGNSGQALQEIVNQTNKLAVLGGVTQEKALETTIALKNAFQIDSKNLSQTIDFLNAVENQTVVALEDLTEAIPRVAPVVQQLGGDVKDLAFFMAAMQEGGISAAQGANALKSGLGSLINPSNKAAEAAAKLGINIKGIVEANQGNLRNIIIGFAKSLEPLTDLQRTRVIEDVFGKYQFARISALLNNVTKEGTQAARVLQLANASVEELAILSERELKVQADSPMNKLAQSVEKLKVAIAPIGELFAKVFTPVINFIAKMAEKFNQLPEGMKKAIAVIVGIVGGLGPIFLMTFGLIANAFANSLKGVNLLRKGYQQLAYGSSDAALKTQYLTQEELENISITNALYSKHQQLAGAYELEAAALASLTGVYRQASTAMGTFSTQNPGLFIPGRAPRKFAQGTTSVPGPRGAGDIVPSMLSPGEAVIPAKQSQKYSGFISQIIQDKVPGFMTGRFPLFGSAANVNQKIRGVEFNQIQAAQAKFSLMSPAEQAALLKQRPMGPKAKVIPLIGKPLSDKLQGITYSSEGSMIKVAVGDEHFFIPPSKLSNLKTKLEENENWMISNNRTDNTAAELIRTIKRKGWNGKSPRPSDIYSRLPKFSNARNSQQNQEIADKRFRSLLKSKNPHLLKLQNYLEKEEKVYLERVLGRDVVSSLKGWDVNKLTPSHIREVRSQKRTPEDWAASKIARDWGWFNSALRGTSFGGVRGGHPLNASQATELLTNLRMVPIEKLSNEKKALRAALEYRLGRNPSYYDEFKFIDNAMMKVKPMSLADGILSVPGPKGAGDIQPAMLAPGEAVIPAKQAKKYNGLISGIMTNSIPGFENSNWTGNPGSWRNSTPVPAVDSWNDPVVPPATSGTRLKNALGSVFRDKDIASIKNFGKETAKAAKESKVAAKALENVKKTANGTAKSLSSTDVAAKGVTTSLGDKTRGFRGWLTGYGNVAQNITDANGVVRPATAAERTNIRQMNRMNFSNKMMPFQMAGMAVPMAAGMYAQKNPESGIAKNMDLIMMLSMLTMLLPMLNSPLKLLAATAVGLIAVFKMQASAIKKNVLEGQKQAESMTMTTGKLEELGKITGKVSATQIAQRQREGRLTELVPVSMDFGQNLVRNSEFGKNLQKTFQETLSNPNLGLDVAVNSLASQLATAVSQGVLTATQAESIAVALTRDLKDAKLELKVRSKLTEIIGPNGEDLTKEPLQVQLKIIESGRVMQAAALKNFQEIAKQQVGISKGEALQLGGAAIPAGYISARSGTQIANMYGNVNTAMRQMETAGKVGRVAKAANVVKTIGMGTRVAAAGTTATGMGAPAGLALAISAVIFGGIEVALRQWQRGKEKQAIAKAAGLFEGVVVQNLAASQQGIDAINAQYALAKQNLEAARKVAKTKEEQAKIDQRIKDLDKNRSGAVGGMRQQQAKILSSVSSAYQQTSKQSVLEAINPFAGTSRGQVRDKFMESFRVGMQEKFKGTASAPDAAVLQSQLDQLKVGKYKDEITLEITTLVNSDVLSPGQASTLLSTLVDSGKDIRKTINTIIKTQETEGLQRLAGVLNLIPDPENRKELLLKVSTSNKKEANEILSSTEELMKIPDYIGIDINLETNKDDIKDLKARGKEIDALKKKFPNGEISLSALIKMREETKGDKNVTLDAAISQWDTLSKLPKDLQFNAMITLGVLQTSDSFNRMIQTEVTAAYAKAYPKARKVTKAQMDAFIKKNPQIKKDAEAKALYEVYGIATPEDDKNNKNNNDDDKAGPTLDLSWANELVQKLKLVKENTLNAMAPLKSLQQFLGGKAMDSRNPYLDLQQGLLKKIEIQANKTGVSLATNLVELLKGLDAEQFNLVYKYLFNVNGTLNETGKIFNEAFKVETVASYLQVQKDTNKTLEGQVTTFNKLVKAGYSMDQIMKILENDALATDLANGNAFSDEELKQFNAELTKTINLNQKISEMKLGFAISDLNKQVEAYNKLNEAGVKQEVILEILKDKSSVLAIANSTGNVAEQFGSLISKSKQYIDILKIIEEQTKTFEQKTQEAIDANVAALDLQAKILQNQFDLANFQLKLKIKLSEDAIQVINDEIQKEQDKIDAINFKLKYDPNFGQTLLDSLQEQINDAQRNIELNFDRPLQALSDRSNILSNDLTLIDKATEEINTKYDKQQDALTKISEINQELIAQEKSRISLADALTRGDISAAAQMAQEMRSNAAAAANKKSIDNLNAARQAEIERLRSASGMTRLQIEKEQFAIGQQSFALEQKRMAAQAAIVLIEDRIYNINEQREAQLLIIAGIEKVIDDIKIGKLAKEQLTLDNLQRELDANQKILDSKLSAIDKEKLGWDSIQLKLDAYKLELDKINKGPLATMKSIVDSIADALATISSAKYSPTSPFVTQVKASDEKTTVLTKEEIAKIEKDAANAAAEAADAAADAAAEEAASLAAADAAAKAAAAAAAISDELNALELALNKKLNYRTPAETEALAKQNAQYAARAAGYAARYGGTYGMSSGGMVKPKYFAFGGPAKGTDIIPAMLTPGEFVVSKYAVDNFGVDGLKAINNGEYEGSKVYNYNLNVNVKSDANPNDIARTVITQIRQIDSQRIRGQRVS